MSHTHERPLEVRRLVEADAEALVDCFESCYGSSYPNADFYEASRLRARIRAGTLSSVVAVTDDNAVVGHTGLTIRRRQDTQPLSAIAGNTVVGPQHRGRGVLGRMGRALAELTIELGFHGYVHFPTTAHPIMQKRSVERGGVETGLLLAYVPETTEYVDIARAASHEPRRLAATIVYQPLQEASAQQVLLPRSYEGVLREIYAELSQTSRLERTLAVGEGSDELRRRGTTRISLTRDERRNARFLEIRNVGTELADRLDAALEGVATCVDYVDLSLSEPSIDPAVEALRARGFFFCGVLPGLVGSDVLRLQRLAPAARAGAFAESAKRLENDGACRLLRILQADSDPLDGGTAE